MRVLILGASGFIGLPAAQALVRAGHIVYGVTRSQEKARQLEADEITPIVAGVEDRSKWLPLVKTLDAVIDSLSGPNLLKIQTDNLNAIISASKELRPAGSAKVSYILTSGTWVHGDNRSEVVSDTTPIYNSIELSAWRPPFETLVVNSTDVTGIVVRPALLYGRSASLLGTLFKSAYEGKAKWHGKPGGRWSLIHQDDLASLYVLVTEKSSILGGKIFDVANDFSESTDDVLQKLVEVSGATSYEYLEPTNAFETALSTSQIVHPYLAKALLGWQPRKGGLVDYLPIYYNAWKASEGLQ